MQKNQIGPSIQETNSMTQAIRRFTRLDNMSEAVSEIRKNGVVVIENLFQHDVMDMLFNHLRPSLDSQ